MAYVEDNNDAAMSAPVCRCPDSTPDEHRLSSWHNTSGPRCWGFFGPCGQSVIMICSCHSPVDERPLDIGFEVVCRRSGMVLDQLPSPPRVIMNPDGKARVVQPEAIVPAETRIESSAAESEPW